MSDKSYKFLKLIEILKKLRAPGGCDWDREQTHESLIPQLLEETHEVIEAIENRNMSDLKEELGDLMFTIVSLSRHLKLNPEKVLNKSIKKFKNRFLYVEKKIYDKKVNLKHNKKALNKYWNEAKRN